MSRAADRLMFAEEPAAPARPPWRVLVVDDDNEVHQVTRLVLGSDGRSNAGEGPLRVNEP